MWRAIVFLTLAILCSALVVALISVYVFHDVDRDKLGHLNEVFADLAVEAAIFALIIGIPSWVLAALGKYLLKLRGYSPRAKLGIILGIAVAVCQYPFEFLGRKLLPQYAELFLSIYLVAAILICAAFLLRDASKQKIQTALESRSTPS
jgi:hypothetical protein